MGQHSKRLIVSAQAEYELIDTARCYEATQLGLGAEFLRRYDEAIELIRQFPESAATLDHEFRRAILRKFPFSIVYRTKSDVTEVIGVVCTKADPLALQSLLSITRLS